MSLRTRLAALATGGLAALATGNLAAQGLLASQDGPPLAPAPTTPVATLAQRLGTALPAALPFVDSDGHAVRLGSSFGGPPVVLVLGYYRCPQLCGLVAQGLLEALRATGLPPDASRLVFVSIDPDETPADAAARLKVDLDYARFLDAGAGAAPPFLRLLTGSHESIATLARAVGAGWRRVAADPAAPAARFAHPAAAIVLTPDGRVSRYLMGVRFDPRELRAALVEAGGGRIGSLTERVALLCAHADPNLGRHGAAALAGARVAALTTLAGVAFIVWRRARQRRG
jgi:protein SCO1/2